MDNCCQEAGEVGPGECPAGLHPAQPLAGTDSISGGLRRGKGIPLVGLGFSAIQKASFPEALFITRNTLSPPR